MNLLGSVSIKSTDLAGFFVGIGQEILMLLLQVRTMVKRRRRHQNGRDRVLIPAITHRFASLLGG